MWISLVIYATTAGVELLQWCAHVAFLCLYFSFCVIEWLKGTCLGCSLDFGMQLVFNFSSFISRFFAPWPDKNCKSTAARPLILNLYKNKIIFSTLFAVLVEILWQTGYLHPTRRGNVEGQEGRDDDKRRSENRRK